MAPLLDGGRVVAHRGDQLAVAVEDVGAAAVAEHDQRLAPGVEEQAFRCGAGQVGQGHARRAVPFAVAALGVLGAPLLAARAFLQTPRQGVDQAVDPLIDHPALSARRLGKLVLDAGQHGLGPAHRIVPRDLSEAVPEVLQGHPSRTGADDVQAEAPALPAGPRGDDLE